MGSSQAARLATAVQHSKQLVPIEPSPVADLSKPKFSNHRFFFSTSPALQTLLNGSPIVSHGEGCFRAARRGDQAHGWAPDLDKLILSIMRDWESAEVTSLHFACVSVHCPVPVRIDENSKRHLFLYNAVRRHWLHNWGSCNRGASFRSEI